MNDLQIFKNEQFGEIRWVKVGNKDYAVASDVARALGYAIPSKAINTHCKGVSKTEVPTSGGIQQMLIIPEGDIYRLTAKSELPGAAKFESWIFDEVLPSIRKHGTYMTDNTIEKALTDPDFLIKLATTLKEEKLRRVEAEKKIVLQEPKVAFADAVSASHTSILVGDLAKLLKQNGVDTGANRLFEKLRKEGYLIKRKGTDYNMPTQKSMELGLFEIKETSIAHGDGHISISKTSKVTGKGQIYFVNKFKELN
jgi:anti-repressor protein